MLAIRRIKSPIACINFTFRKVQNTSPMVNTMPEIMSIRKLAGVTA